MITFVSNTLQRWLLPVADKISRNRYLLAIKDSFLISLPFTMFGSIILAVVNIPFLDKIFAEATVAMLQSSVTPIINVTFNLVALLVVLGVGYRLGESYKLNSIYTAFSALISFLIVTPVSELLDGSTGYALGSLGSMSIFTGIIVAIVSTEIYRLCSNDKFSIKMPESVPTMVSDSFSSLVPASIVMLFSLFVYIAFKNTSFNNINNFVYTLIQVPISRIGTSFGATLISGALVNLFWFFGLHGNAIVYNSVLSPMFKANSIANLTAFQAKTPLPNIITEEFAFYFGGFNGSFIAYPILICIFVFFKKRKDWKKLGEVSLVPGIFSIYEPVVFGLPLMLNPIFLIPMLLTPMISATISYLFMVTNLCPWTTGVSIPWTTPMVLSGIITTNSIMGGVVQIVIIIVLTALWYIFMKIAYKNEEVTHA